jgi:hypothetical protein
MDPDRALQLAADAIEQGDYVYAQLTLEGLNDWLVAGGVWPRVASVRRAAVAGIRERRGCFYMPAGASLSGVDEDVKCSHIHDGIRRNQAEAVRLASTARKAGCPECRDWTETAKMYFRNAEFFAKQGDLDRALEEYEVGLKQLGKADMCIKLRAHPSFFASFGKHNKRSA